MNCRLLNLICVIVSSVAFGCIQKNAFNGGGGKEPNQNPVPDGKQNSVVSPMPSSNTLPNSSLPTPTLSPTVLSSEEVIQTFTPQDCDTRPLLAAPHELASKGILFGLRGSRGFLICQVQKGLWTDYAIDPANSHILERLDIIQRVSGVLVHTGAEIVEAVKSSPAAADRIELVVSSIVSEEGIVVNQALRGSPNTGFREFRLL